jgi:hypothetical protein
MFSAYERISQRAGKKQRGLASYEAVRRFNTTNAERTAQNNANLTVAQKTVI